MPHHPDNTDHLDPALILLGGEPVDPSLLDGLASPGMVVAADSGIDQAHRLGLVVDIAVGDFDSVSHEGLARAEAEGASIHRHPAAKAETDMVLALEVALDSGRRDVLVAGGAGGRLDHLLANALVMASPRFAPLGLRAIGPDGSRLHVVRGEVSLVGQVGEYISLLAVHGPAVGVRTTGLRYPLDGERLDAGSSRGVSNELTSPMATVAVDDGVLLAVLPGPTFTPPHTRGTD